MKTKIVHSLFLLLAIESCYSQFPGCPTSSCPVRRQLATLSPSTQPVLWIGHMTSLHTSQGLLCGLLDWRGVMSTQAVTWAVSTAKQRLDLSALQQYDLGAFTLDYCSNDDKLVQVLLEFSQCDVQYSTPRIQPSAVLGWLGPDWLDDASRVSSLMSSHKQVRIAQTIGYDVDNYHFHASASLNLQVSAVVNLFRSLNVLFVQIISDESLDSKELKQQFVSSYSGCVINDIIISESFTVNDTYNLLEERREASTILAIGRQDLITQFSVRPSDFDFIFLNDPQALDTSGSRTILGSLHFVVESTGDITSFLDHWYSADLLPDETNPFKTELFESVLDCNINQGNRSRTCTASDSLRGVFPVEPLIGSTINAVDHLLIATNNSLHRACQIDGICSFPLTFSSVHETIRDELARVLMSQPEPTIAVYNIQRTTSGAEAIKIGSYATDTGLVFTSIVKTYDSSGTERPSFRTAACNAPCEECVNPTTIPPTAGTTENVVKCKSSLRSGAWPVVLLVLSLLGFIITVSFNVYFIIRLRNTTLWTIRAFGLGQILLISLTMVFFFTPMYAWSAGDSTCVIRRVLSGSLLALMFSVLLVKLVIILTSLDGGSQILLLLLTASVQISLDVQWVLLKPPVAVYSESHCSCSPVFTDHLASFTCVVVLMCVCLGLSIAARDYTSNYSEAKFIGIASGISLVLFVIWASVGGSADSVDTSDAAVGFGLLITALVVFFLIYTPKFYQLLTKSSVSLKRPARRSGEGPLFVNYGEPYNSLQHGTLVYGQPYDPLGNGTPMYGQSPTSHDNTSLKSKNSRRSAPFLTNIEKASTAGSSIGELRVPPQIESTDADVLY